MAVMIPMSVTSGYLHHVMSPASFRATIQRLLSVLRPHQDKFDAIAFRGVSGGLVGGVLCMELNKKMLVVRKMENAHSTRLVEGDYSARRYIIVDDQISTGATVKAIREAIADKVSEAAECVGVVCYFGYPEPYQEGGEIYDMFYHDFAANPDFILACESASIEYY